MTHPRSLFSLRLTALFLGGLPVLATLVACQPEYHSFVGYQKETFSMAQLQGHPVALYVVGGRTQGIAQVEEAIVRQVKARDVVTTEQMLGLFKKQGVAPLPASALPVMNSDYQSAVAAKTLGPVLDVVRTQTKAPYLVVCAGWLGANKLEGRARAWDANPLANHTGSVKIYVAEAATGDVVAITHAVVLSPDAAKGKVDIDSRKLKLDQGIFEKTAQEAVAKLGELEPRD